MSKARDYGDSFPPELCQSFSSTEFYCCHIYFSSRICLHWCLIITLTGLVTISKGNESKSTVLLLTCNCSMFWTCYGSVDAL